jgi:hypothetical protein
MAAKDWIVLGNGLYKRDAIVSLTPIDQTSWVMDGTTKTGTREIWHLRVTLTNGQSITIDYADRDERESQIDTAAIQLHA